MTTTTRNITDAQMRALRNEAAQAADFVQVAICDLALDGTFNRDDYTTLDRAESDRVAGMTQDDAIAECARVIAETAARS